MLEQADVYYIIILCVLMLRGVIMAVPDCPALHYSVDEKLLIQQYCEKGYMYKDIRAFTEIKHGIVLSEDQLRGWLKCLCLK